MSHFNLLLHDSTKYCILNNNNCYYGEQLMKIGSVQFYKKLILTSLGLLITIPTGLSIYFAYENFQLSQELEVLLQPDSRLISEENWVASVDGPLHTEAGNPVVYAEEIPSLNYQSLYPDLFVERNEFREVVDNSVYLTFDDGPSAMTPNILEVLKEKDVKATFFVVYDDSPFAAELLKQIVAEGHAIGVHTTSHIYPLIYSSVEAYLTDFEQTARWIETVTGVKPNIFRFPGGSINAYNYSTYEAIIAEMIRRGYVYYDWNVSSGDASGSSTVRSVMEGVINGVVGKNKSIVLMHDNEAKKATVQALPIMIDQLRASDHLLLPLNHTVKPITFSYPE